MAESPLVDRPPAQLGLRERYGLSLLAISRSGEVITKRLRSLELRPGEVMVVHGARNVMPDALRELRCLPLAERDLALAGSWARHLPALLLAAAMALVALELVPIAIAFFGLSVVLLVSQVLTLRSGLRRDPLADPDPARGADTGERGRAHDRRHRFRVLTGAVRLYKSTADGRRQLIDSWSRAIASGCSALATPTASGRSPPARAQDARASLATALRERPALVNRFSAAVHYLHSLPVRSCSVPGS